MQVSRISVLYQKNSAPIAYYRVMNHIIIKFTLSRCLNTDQKISRFFKIKIAQAGTAVQAGPVPVCVYKSILVYHTALRFSLSLQNLRSAGVIVIHQYTHARGVRPGIPSTRITVLFAHLFQRTTQNSQKILSEKSNHGIVAEISKDTFRERL